MRTEGWGGTYYDEVAPFLLSPLVFGSQHYFLSPRYLCKEHHVRGYCNSRSR
jgi:hypothetical protein